MLTIGHRAGSLAVVVGPDALATVAWPPTTVASSSADCTGRLHFDDRSWLLTFDGEPLASGVAAPPVVSGFYTKIDPNGAGAVRAELVTQPFGSRPSTRQWILHASTVVFALLALGALWLQRPASSNPLVRPRRRTEDVVVVATLGFWWLAGPWFFDDGWLMATVRAHRVSGSFNNYFDTFAAQMPLGFAHHMLLSPFAKTDAPFLVWRAVPLAACVATWFLLRVIHATVAGHEGRRRGTVALAGAFTIFAIAWLMTLRPEPIVALLSAVVGVTVLDHVRTRSSLSLAAAVVAAAVASTLHPSGLVVCAPLVIALPSLARTACRSMAGTASVATAGLLGLAAGVTCLFADTDVELWRRSRSLFANDGFHSNGVLDESIRYRDLFKFGTIPAIATVLFSALALVCFAVHWLRRSDRSFTLADSAALSLIVAVGFLTITPSKWTYHFGSAAADRVDGHRGPVRTGGHDNAGRWWPRALLILTGLVAARAVSAKADAAVLHEAGHTPHLVCRSGHRDHPSGGGARSGRTARRAAKRGAGLARACRHRERRRARRSRGSWTDRRGRSSATAFPISSVAAARSPMSCSSPIRDRPRRYPRPRPLQPASRFTAGDAARCAPPAARARAGGGLCH